MTRDPATRGGPLPFLFQEYLRVLRGRPARIAAAMIAYAVVAMPFIMAKPPPEVVEAFRGWLGAGAAPAKLVLFVWVDAAMNKIAMIMGPVLAGGILLDERERGSIDLFASKPVGAADYFTIKVLAAQAVMATIYLAGVAGALATFPWRVRDFAPGPFLALSAVHLFAALFAVALAATVGVSVGRRLPGMLLSITVLSLLVGLAFLGFYHPAYRAVSYLNPIFHGVELLGRVEDFGAWDVGRPIGVLIGFNVGVISIGRWRAAALLEGPPGRSSRSGRRRAEAGDGRPFVRLLLWQSRSLLGVRHLLVLVGLCLLGSMAFWLPTFPAAVARLFDRAFHLADWSEVVLANDLTALFFFVYWIGVFDALTVVVVPREVRTLELVLSKPIRRSSYVLAKLLPILGAALAIGALAGGAHAAGLAAAGLGYPIRPLVGATCVVVGLAVLLVALVHLLIIPSRDSYTALLVAFVPMLLVLFPAMIYLYRPDVFAGSPALKELVVFPMNLIWHKDAMARWGAPIGALLVAASIPLAVLAGRRLERREVAA